MIGNRLPRMRRCGAGIVDGESKARDSVDQTRFVVFFLLNSPIAARGIFRLNDQISLILSRGFFASHAGAVGRFRLWRADGGQRRSL